MEVLKKQTLHMHDQHNKTSHSSRMVYTKGILISLTLVIMCTIELSTGTKFAYKKPIYGKANNAIKEKRYKVKSDALVVRPVPESTTTLTTSSTTSTTTTTPSPPSTASSPASSPEFLDVEQNSAAPEAAAISNESTLNEEITTPLYIITTSTPAATEQSSIEAAETAVLDMPYISLANENALLEDSTAYETSTSSIATVIAPPTEQPPVAVALPKVVKSPPPPPPSNQPVACTCGVFLSSQVQKGMKEQPLILNELDRMYPCNAIGRKQCQTKCLEAIVQHLPNSANIVCATLGNDCHKERAYLFIKNCQNQWWNTNLQAGREYCCKGGQPYRCPLI